MSRVNQPLLKAGLLSLMLGLTAGTASASAGDDEHISILGKEYAVQLTPMLDEEGRLKFSVAEDHIVRAMTLGGDDAKLHPVAVDKAIWALSEMARERLKPVIALEDLLVKPLAE